MEKWKDGAKVVEGRFFSGKPTPIAEILKEYLEKEGIGSRIRAYSSLTRFEEWFPELAPFCRPVRFSGGILYLLVSDPLFALKVKGKITAIREKFQKEGLSVERVKIQCT
ncbi:MAG: DciA family protein [Candidatus Caldatribacteriaceae bacterium]